jgi:hypothetical protein
MSSKGLLIPASVNFDTQFTRLLQSNNITDGTLSLREGYLTNLASVPLFSLQATPKQYVDVSVVNGPDKGSFVNTWKTSAMAATTDQIAPFPPTTGTIVGLIDNYAPKLNDRILVKNQGSLNTTAHSANGIYLVTSGTWLRTDDAQLGNFATGTIIYVASTGTLNNNTVFACTTLGTKNGSTVYGCPITYNLYGSNIISGSSGEVFYNVNGNMTGSSSIVFNGTFLNFNILKSASIKSNILVSNEPTLDVNIFKNNINNLVIGKSNTTNSSKIYGYGGRIEINTSSTNSILDPVINIIGTNDDLNIPASIDIKAGASVQNNGASVLILPGECTNQTSAGSVHIGPVNPLSDTIYTNTTLFVNYATINSDSFLILSTGNSTSVSTGALVTKGGISSNNLITNYFYSDDSTIDVINSENSIINNEYTDIVNISSCTMGNIYLGGVNIPLIFIHSARANKYTGNGTSASLISHTAYGVYKSVSSSIGSLVANNSIVTNLTTMGPTIANIYKTSGTIFALTVSSTMVINNLISSVSSILSLVVSSEFSNITTSLKNNTNFLNTDTSTIPILLVNNNNISNLSAFKIGITNSSINTLTINSINSTNATFQNIRIGSSTIEFLEIGSGSHGSISLTSSTIVNLSARNVIDNNIIIVSQSATNLLSTNSTISSLYNTSGSFGNLSSVSDYFNNLNSTTSSIQNLGINSGYITSNSSTYGTLNSLQVALGLVNDIKTTFGSLRNLSISSSTIQNFNITNASSGNLKITSFSGNITTVNSTIPNIIITNFSVGNLVDTAFTINNLSVVTESSIKLSVSIGSIQNLYVLNSTISNIFANNGSSSNINVQSGTIGPLSVGTIIVGALNYVSSTSNSLRLGSNSTGSLNVITSSIGFLSATNQKSSTIYGTNSTIITLLSSQDIITNAISNNILVNNVVISSGTFGTLLGSSETRSNFIVVNGSITNLASSISSIGSLFASISSSLNAVYSTANISSVNVGTINTMFLSNTKSSINNLYVSTLYSANLIVSQGTFDKLLITNGAISILSVVNATSLNLISTSSSVSTLNATIITSNFINVQESNLKNSEIATLLVGSSGGTIMTSSAGSLLFRNSSTIINSSLSDLGSLVIGGKVTASSITGLRTPSNNSDISNKQYANFRVAGAAGTIGQIQYNDGASHFAANANFVYTGTSLQIYLTTAAISNITGALVVSGNIAADSIFSRDLKANNLKTFSNTFATKFSTNTLNISSVVIGSTGPFLFTANQNNLNITPTGTGSAIIISANLNACGLGLLGSITVQSITTLSYPLNPYDISNKYYVDLAISKGTVAGIYGQVQYNNFGLMAAASMSFNGTNVSIDLTTASTSISSGSLIISGGIGISGDVYATSYNTPSDIRFKSSISSISNPLDIIKSITGYKYLLKKDNEQHFGFIAQDLQDTEVSRLVANNDSEDNFKAVNYIEMIPIISEAIKELYNMKISK